MLVLRSRLVVLFTAVALCFPGLIRAAAERFTVPSLATEPALKLVPGDHACWLNTGVPARGELLIFITGTTGRNQGPGEFLRTAADLGYHVVLPLYMNDVPASVCRNDRNPAAFENFRREIIEGRDLTARLEVGRADSLENRIVKLVQWLARNRPATENWAQFLDAKGAIVWSKVVLAGRSQGGGHALLMAQDREVARVVMTGAPKDYSQALHKPAAWYRPGKTPANRMFAFVHEQDLQGCTMPEQRENFTAAGLTPVANIDELAPPFGHAHALTTNFPGTPLDSVTAHTSVIADRNTPRNADGTPRFKPVWVYLLTTPVD